MKYRVFQEYICENIYEIEAASPEEAIELIKTGEYEWHLAFVDTTDIELTGEYDVQVIEE